MSPALSSAAVGRSVLHCIPFHSALQWLSADSTRDYPQHSCGYYSTRRLLRKIRSHPISSDLIRSRPISSDLVRSRPISSDLVRSRPISSDLIRSHPISSDVANVGTHSLCIQSVSRRHSRALGASGYCCARLVRLVIDRSTIVSLGCAVCRTAPLTVQPERFEVTLSVRRTRQVLEWCYTAAKPYPSQRTGAQYNLAMSLLKGMGIEANAEEATYWFQKAAAQAPIVYADRFSAAAVPILSTVTACHRRTESLVARPRPLRCRRSSSSLFAFDPTMQSHLSITAAQIRMKGKGLGLPQYATACAIGRKGCDRVNWPLTVWCNQMAGPPESPTVPEHGLAGRWSPAVGQLVYVCRAQHARMRLGFTSERHRAAGAQGSRRSPALE